MVFRRLPNIIHLGAVGSARGLRAGSGSKLT
jgi:hypothetical protein